jgi:hypothetical protein
MVVTPQGKRHTIFSKRSSQTVPDRSSKAPVFQVGIPHIRPLRFGKCSRSPSATSIASVIESPNSSFMIQHTISVLPVCVPK